MCRQKNLQKEHIHTGVFTDGNLELYSRNHRYLTSVGDRICYINIAYLKVIGHCFQWLLWCEASKMISLMDFLSVDSVPN
jgi:hypothetical protein